jgi:hypothetical protein
VVNGRIERLGRGVVPSSWEPMAPTERPPDPSALDGAGGGAPCYLYVDCDRFYFAVEAAERPARGGTCLPGRYW